MTPASILGATLQMRLCRYVKLSHMPSRSLGTCQPLSGKWGRGKFIIKCDRKGDRSNPLARIPDWSFVDGRPAAPSSHMNTHMELQKQICKRIVLLRSEMANAKGSMND